LIGADPSTGKKGELWGVSKAGKDLSLLQAWFPPGIALKKQVHLGDHSLDAVGLSGMLSQGLEDFEMGHLSDAFLMMATGRTAVMHNRH
jgi:hypothetical protein